MSDLDDVLIVIPCLNEAATLPGLLAELAADSGRATIVVADGGSTDGSQAIVADWAARHANIVLMDNPARRQAPGVNLAVARHGAGARWLVRVDAHCGYPRDYARALVRTAEAQGVQSVVVPMVTRGSECFQRAVAAAQNSAIGTGGSPHRHVGTGKLVDHGHHALMALDTFRAAGGYRPDMSHNEDAELDCRIARVGGRIWLEPSLALAYYPRKTARALWRQYWAYGRGRARTIALHRIAIKPRQLLPLAVPAAAALALLTPWLPIVALPLLGWAALCLGAGAVVGTRAGGCAAFAGIPAMIMHLAWGCGFLYQRLADPQGDRRGGAPARA